MQNEENTGRQYTDHNTKEEDAFVYVSPSFSSIRLALLSLIGCAGGVGGRLGGGWDAAGGFPSGRPATICW